MNKIFFQISISLFILSLFVIPHGFVFADSAAPPKIISISPTAVSRDNIVEIIGGNFGGVYTGEVVINGSRITDIEDWSDTKIRVGVRGFTGTGDLPLFIRSNQGGVGNLVDSNTISLRVLQKSPKILSITPNKVAPQGTTVEIVGENFGATQATYGGKLFDINYQGTHQILSWSDTRIRAIYNLESGAWGDSSPPSSYLQVRVKCLDTVCNNYESGLGLTNRPVDEYWSEGDILSRISIETPICISWTYSDWNDCSANGQQTRTTITSSPQGCRAGNPVTVKSCVYTPPPSKYICYPNCDARVCVNNSCNQSGYMKAVVGDKISIVHRDLKLAKKITVGSVQIDGWNLKDDILEFFLPDNIKTGGVFVNVYHADGNLIADGTLTIYSKSTLPPPPSCIADTWICGTWGSCSPQGIQTRSCNKTFDCPSTETAAPAISQYCEAPNKPAQQTPTEDLGIVNQDSIVKATVKLLCPVNTTMAAQGSGTIIDSRGTILTNKHVIEGTMGCLVGFVNNYNDEPYFGDRQIADIYKVSSDADIAILKLRNPNNRSITAINITTGDSSNLRLGDQITTYGYPAKFGTKITYTSGDFSGVNGNYLKTTAIIDKGNSGGGAYLKNGTFIGIPSEVTPGFFNIMGKILSINKINSWLNNSPIAYDSGSSNSYSRVSLLEDIDLNTLDSLNLFISDSSTTNQTSPSSANQRTVSASDAKEITTQQAKKLAAWRVWKDPVTKKVYQVEAKTAKTAVTIKAKLDKAANDELKAITKAKVEAAKKASQKGNNALVSINNSVYVRQSNNAKSKILGTAKKGTSYKFIEEKSGWVKINFNGKDGWVSRAYVNIK